ncbi:toll-like receptor 4 [Saccoglossus kowalevskii]|uniref:Toll-like receptor 13-like n=1 Tax=Saccoglossus kowalevskii TaxID=10224 RepID=A0ABM0MZ90_SACKO|nr:PREDICTED: toll-like receptor 13-like [Saccoglossus kowalevskii]
MTWKFFWTPILNVFFTILLSSRGETRCVSATNITCPEGFSCEFCAFSYESWGNLKLVYNLKSVSDLKELVSRVPSETVLLYLQSAGISGIKNGTFSKLGRLLKLYLHGNNLVWNLVELDAFQGLSSLQLLDLSVQRGINQVRREWFLPLSKLVKIQLESNIIKSLPGGTFANNVQLETILLHQNKLTELPDDIMRDLPKLKRAMFQTNEIKTLPGNLLGGSTQVTELNFAHNRLSTISSEIGFQKDTNLTSLHLYNNPIECNCDLIWFRNWVSTVNVLVSVNDTMCLSGYRIVDFNPDTLECGFPYIKIIVLSVSGLLLISVLIAMGKNRWRIRYSLHLVKARLLGYQPLVDGDDDEYEYDVFLSHSSKDEEWVSKVLHPTLENPPYNYKLCLDYRDFIVGETIADNIIDAVQKSRKTAFILTKSFVESEWCYFELEMVRQQMFDEHRDLAILIMKENVPTGDMPGLLKYLMRKGNHIEWSDNKHGELLFWSKLDSALKCRQHNIV